MALTITVWEHLATITINMAMAIITSSGTRVSTAEIVESLHTIKLGQQDRTSLALTIATEVVATIITTQELTTIALAVHLHASSNRSSQGRHQVSETASVVAVHQEVDLTGGVVVETAADLHPIDSKIAALMETAVTIQ